MAETALHREKENQLIIDSMIKIDHIAIHVNELEAVKDFFIQYFKAKANDLYVNPIKGNRSYFLSFDNDTRLEIINKPGLRCVDRDFQEYGYHHLAFSIGGKDKVDKLTQLLQDGGYEVMSGPRLTGDGYYESCVQGPENILLEITE